MLVLKDLGKLLLANASSAKSNVFKYTMHVLLKLYTNFWKFQEALIDECRLKCGLIIVQVHLASVSPLDLVAKFVKATRKKG